MPVVFKKQFIECWGKHLDVAHPLKAWHDESTAADWETPPDIKGQIVW